MTNRIRNVHVSNHRLDPHETELRIHVEVEGLTPTMAIKGRLVGPRSVYSSTVEIAYTVREVARASELVELRVVIPEASWWEPKKPFLYQGRLELWQDDTMRESVTIRHGIRRLQTTSTGLKLNGRPLLLRGKAIAAHPNERELMQLHDQGMNVVLLNVASLDTDVWQWADRSGLLVLNRALPPLDFVLMNPVDYVMRQQRPPDDADPLGWLAQSTRCRTASGQAWANLWHGVKSADSDFAKTARFTICEEAERTAPSGVALPWIVLSPHLPEPLPTRPDVIGWIESTS